MASIRASLDLQQEQKSDEKPFLFVVENVPLELTSEDIQMQISAKVGCQVKIYRAY
jgi:hypothetical protein